MQFIVKQAKENVSPQKIQEFRQIRFTKYQSCFQLTENMKNRIQTKPIFYVLGQDQSQIQTGSDKADQIMKWFQQKGIAQGNPQNLIKKHSQQQKMKVRQLTSNGLHFSQLRMKNSTLLKKRSAHFNIQIRH